MSRRASVLVITLTAGLLAVGVAGSAFADEAQEINQAQNSFAAVRERPSPASQPDEMGSTPDAIAGSFASVRERGTIMPTQPPVAAPTPRAPAATSSTNWLQFVALGLAGALSLAMAAHVWGHRRTTLQRA